VKISWRARHCPELIRVARGRVRQADVLRSGNAAEAIHRVGFRLRVLEVSINAEVCAA
jgi:hypothetical protein